MKKVMGRGMFTCPAEGTTVVFKGIVWNAHWEFDCPGIIYAPVERYDCTLGSISVAALEGMVDDICCDMVCDMRVRRGFTDFDLREFKGRNWTVKKLLRRRNVVKAEIPVRFYVEDGYMTYEILKAST